MALFGPWIGKIEIDPLDFIFCKHIGQGVRINGEKADIIKFNDCFCALKLKEGDNDIRLTFMPYGMGTAVIMAAAGIILLDRILR